MLEYKCLDLMLRTISSEIRNGNLDCVSDCKTILKEYVGHDWIHYSELNTKISKNICIYNDHNIKAKLIFLINGAKFNTSSENIYVILEGAVENNDKIFTNNDIIEYVDGNFDNNHCSISDSTVVLNIEFLKYVK